MTMMTYVIIGAIALVGVLLCFCLAVASFASENFYEKLEENQQKPNSKGIRTVEYVREINTQNFRGRLRIERCQTYEDHYSSGVVALSSETMNSNSLASLATVSHELGHARQDAEGNKLKKHWRRKQVGRLCGLFFMPVVIVGIVLSVLYLVEVLPELYVLILGLAMLALGVLIFLFAVFLKYKEIQIEKEASRYAIEFLQEILTREECKSCQEFLNSARLTYWALFFKTLLSWTFLTSKDPMFR